MIATIGLGDARLRAGDCRTKAGATPKTLLRIAADSEGTRICVCIPKSAFPASGTATGKLVATSPPTTAEAEVTLSGSMSPSQHFVAALLWGLGFALPALFSTYVGQRVYLWQKRKDEERETIKTRREQQRVEPAAVQTFFNTFLPGLANSPDNEFADEIRGQFGSIERYLSNEDATAINQALDTNNRARIVAILRKNFPGRDTVLDSVKNEV